MTYYHGIKKKKSYFEGWYFKHLQNGNMLAFIPGMSIDRRGSRHAFIQIIDNNSSYFIPYSYADFCASADCLHIKVGNSEFTEKGIKIDIQTEELRVFGSVSYGKLTPIDYDIMGPFRHVPFMQCNHGLLSLRHATFGSIRLNHQTIDFSGGTGYIEKDFGSSFPSSYVWLQCNTFQNSDCSVMLSVADIPFLGCHFEGCIGIVYLDRREYRFATYKGVRILCRNDKKIILKQGDYTLDVTILGKSGLSLFAPRQGVMERQISENSNCRAHFRLCKQGNILLNEDCGGVSFEYVK